MHAPSGHAFVGIGGEARDARRAGKVRHQAAAVGNRGIAQRRIGRQRFFFVYVERRTGNPVLPQGARQGRFIDYRPARVIHQERSRLHQPQGPLVEQMIRGRRAFSRTQQRHMYADEVSFAEGIFEPCVLDPVLFPRDAARMAQIHVLLNSSDVIVVLISRVVAQHVHVEAGAFLDDGQPDASRADDRDGLARYLVAQKRQVRMPISPLVVAGEVLGGPHLARQHAKHEEGELRGSLGENVGRVGERNLVAVGVGTVDVVESDGELGHDFQSVLAGLKDFGIDGIAQRGD